MSQITTGLHSVLSYSFVYSTIQYLMGARAGWKNFVERFVQANSQSLILDIGCGPADILEYLPQDIQYWGFDVSSDYIKKAQQKYKARGSFFAKSLDEADLAKMPKFDRVIMVGVLHHLDDVIAHQVIRLSHSALKDGGKLVTVDPCYKANQNIFARFLISKDRGQNVRNESGYKQLIADTFNHSFVQVVDKTWIPYTHCYMVCTK